MPRVQKQPQQFTDPRLAGFVNIDSEPLVSPESLLVGASGLGGAAIAEDRGAFLKDRLRGLLKGVGTGLGAVAGGRFGTGPDGVSQSTLGYGAAGGALGYLGATGLLKLTGLDTPRPYRPRKDDRRERLGELWYGKDSQDQGVLAPRPPVATGPSVLQQLLQAKAHSDKKQYLSKHIILRKLLTEDPDSFAIDGTTPDGFAYGLTHVPTGFRIHLPVNLMPPGVQLSQATTGNQGSIKSADDPQVKLPDRPQVTPTPTPPEGPVPPSSGPTIPVKPDWPWSMGHMSSPDRPPEMPGRNRLPETQLGDWVRQVEPHETGFSGPVSGTEMVRKFVSRIHGEYPRGQMAEVLGKHLVEPMTGPRIPTPSIFFSTPGSQTSAQLASYGPAAQQMLEEASGGRRLPIASTPAGGQTAVDVKGNARLTMPGSASDEFPIPPGLVGIHELEHYRQLSPSITVNPSGRSTSSPLAGVEAEMAPSIGDIPRLVEWYDRERYLRNSVMNAATSIGGAGSTPAGAIGSALAAQVRPPVVPKLEYGGQFAGEVRPTGPAALLNRLPKYWTSANRPGSELDPRWLHEQAQQHGVLSGQHSMAEMLNKPSGREWLKRVVGIQSESNQPPPTGSPPGSVP